MAHIGKLVVCGVGLIGGSFALALRRAGAVERIVGIGRRREVLERACALGVIDEIAEGWADALDGADLVLLAAPVGQTDAIQPRWRRTCGPGRFDYRRRQHQERRRRRVAHSSGTCLNIARRFVPAHPIAGAENSGAEAAKADLYMPSRKVVLTPLKESRPEAVERVRDAWTACGANVHRHGAAGATIRCLPR
jgi:prephenate dehydrogenase